MKKEIYMKNEIISSETNLFILSSLAMDLKRMALGIYRGSLRLSDRFEEKALKRLKIV